MSAIDPITITLPPELARMVREKVSSGEYADESEVVQEGLMSLAERDRGFERWLREEMPHRLREFRDMPETMIPADDVFAAIDDRHRDRMAGAKHRDE